MMNEVRVESDRDTLKGVTSSSFEPVYVNRKTLADPRVGLGATVRSLLGEIPEGVPVLLFDFNLAPRAEEIAGAPVINIVHTDSAVTSKQLNWALHSETQPTQEVGDIYRTFVDHSRNARIIHIDHHYDIPAVGLTSTTPLTLGLLLWCHQAGELAFLSRLESGVAVFDHSDADILLSQYLASRALDLPFLEKYGPLLAKVAVLNDHLIVPSDPIERESVHIVYGVVQGLEHAIAARTVAPRLAFNLIEPAIEFALACSKAPGLTVNDLIARHRADQGSPVADPYGMLGLCVDGAGRADYERTLLATIPKVVLPTTSEIGGRNGVHRVGDVVFATFEDVDRDIAGSQVVLALLTEHGKFMEGVQVIVTTYPAEDGFFMKFRAVISNHGEFFDLNRVYRRLRTELSESMGKAANGRATAGGMGKSVIHGDPSLYLAEIAPIIVDEVSR